MNLVDCIVVGVLSEPKFEYGHWFVKDGFAEVMTQIENETKINF